MGSGEQLIDFQGVLAVRGSVVAIEHRHAGDLGLDRLLQVELEAMAGEPMDVLVNGYLIAQGEVVVVNEKFGIRLTDIVTPSERMRRLSRT